MTRQRYRKHLALLALLLLASVPPSVAAPPASASEPAPVRLAWDRVGAPINIRSSA